MKPTRTLLAAIIFSISLASLCFAGNAATGTTVGDFLKLSGGVRAAGMGGAFVAVSDDNAAMFWNPAGLAQTSSREFSSTYTSWFQGVYLADVSMAAPVMKDTRAGLSFTYLNMGEIDETTLGHPGGTGRTFNPTDIIATLSASRRFVDGCYAGASVKILNENIADGNSSAGMAIDYGIIAATPYKGITFGAAVTNVGNLGGMDPLTSAVSAGLAWRLLPNNSLLLACDLDCPNDNYPSLHSGLEYFPVSFLCVRLGVNSVQEQNAGGNMACGLGLKLGEFSVDYAYAPYGDLGDVHRASISIRF
jgi:hypothetical protein